ncbi:MAG: helicase-associated domain-containing protein [Actinomycetes bacterium]
MPARLPRSLADDLRARDDDALAALLRARPDLVTPVPADVASLAARASTRASVQRVVDRLDTPTLQVLEAVAALDEPVTLRDLARACGTSQTVVGRYVARLRELALLWGPDRALRPVRTAEEVLGPYPAGLGPPLADLLARRAPSRVAELCEDLDLPSTRDQATDAATVTGALADPAFVAALLERAPAPARDLLARLTPGPPVGSTGTARGEPRAAEVTGPVDWLLARALLVPVGADRVVLPREVGTALRGGVVHTRLDLEPPALTVTTRRPQHVEAAAAGQAVEAVRLTEQLVETWSAWPAPVLRAGGLGVRQLKRVADTLEVDIEQAAFVVEIAWAAGLVADDGEADPSWVPTPAYDAWRAAGPAGRWAALAVAWRATSRVPGLVGTRDGRDAVRNALAADLDRPSAAAVRRDVLAELAALPPGESPDPDGLAARVAWRAPRRSGPLARQLVTWSLREAAWLGVTGLGALAAAGREVAAGADEETVTKSLAAALPEPVDHVLLQADLTAVAPGPLTPVLAGELALLADVDSRGGATVYRFTPTSVRRALDAGRSADEVLTLLAEHSRTAVPQPLEYLVTDVARRHGRLRVGAASAYLRADDEHLLAEVLADRRSATLRLRRLAPTVLAAQADPTTVLDTLRAMGLAPAAETAEGDVVVRRPDAHRTPPRERPRPVTADPPVPPDHLIGAVVTALRAGDATAADRQRHQAGAAGVPTVPVMEPAVSLATLRDAAADRREVWVGVADPGGRTARRRVQPLSVAGGRVTVVDVAHGDVRTLSVHRITGVAAAEP